jgi:putative acetyltransferase
MNTTRTRLNIRLETPSDRTAIADVLYEAFGQTDESELVDRIRQSNDYVSELTLVAEKDAKIVGFIMLSYAELKHESEARPILALGPLAVHPDYQKRGIGVQLVKEAVALADSRGEQLIISLGHGQYYPRLGFRKASSCNILPPRPWTDEAFLAKTLSRYEPALCGTAHYPAAWDLLLG